MKHLFIIITLIAISCKNNNQETISIDSKPKDTVKVEHFENNKKTDSINIVKINFEKNKDLLDIILLLPDSVFASWEWKLKDRIKWYNEIKENNFYTDDTPDYFNQKYFAQNKAGFSIVDGFWSINIYKTIENSYVVITDDIVGDGNTLNIYEVKSNILKPFSDEKTLFSDFKEQLKKKENNKNCEEKFNELNDPIFEFDFTSKNKIEIESSWYLIKEEYENCLIGNALLYRFNPESKKFELEKVYWKSKTNN